VWLFKEGQQNQLSIRREERRANEATVRTGNGATSLCGLRRGVPCAAVISPNIRGVIERARWSACVWRFPSEWTPRCASRRGSRPAGLYPLAGIRATFLRPGQASWKGIRLAWFVYVGERRCWDHISSLGRRVSTSGPTAGEHQLSSGQPRRPSLHT
jgi:hypothetical protein